MILNIYFFVKAFPLRFDNKFNIADIKSPINDVPVSSTTAGIEKCMDNLQINDLAVVVEEIGDFAKSHMVICLLVRMPVTI